MNRQQLIESVRVKIDEVSTSSEIVVDVSFGEGKNVGLLIDDLLDESAIEILSAAPVHRLSLSSIMTAGTQITAYSGEIKLNADFLRFVSLKMADFTRTITQLAPEGSVIDKRQNNQYYRGTKDRPIGILVSKSDGLYVRYYGTESSHVNSGLLYVKKDTADNIPTILQPALCWLCASKVLSVMGDTNGAKTAFEYYNNGIV